MIYKSDMGPINRALGRSVEYDSDTERFINELELLVRLQALLHWKLQFGSLTVVILSDSTTVCAYIRLQDGIK